MPAHEAVRDEERDGPGHILVAREILNDWEAIIAFTTNKDLPPTNNDAETALRHAAILNVIETCRRRKLDAWEFIAKAVQAARQGERSTPLLGLA
jgi:hypothetical protein